MTILILILAFVALVACGAWLIHRRSVSLREEEAERREEERLAQEAKRDLAVMENRRRVREAERNAIGFTEAPRAHRPGRSEQKIRARHEDDGYQDGLPIELDSSLADYLLTPSDVWGNSELADEPAPEPVCDPEPSWRELPESYRETPAPHHVESSAPQDDTGRYIPVFDSGYCAPVFAPDPPPYTAFTGSGESSTSTTSWGNDSGTTGGSSDGGHTSSHSHDSGGWSDSGSSSSPSDSGGGYGGGD